MGLLEHLEQIVPPKEMGGTQEFILGFDIAWFGKHWIDRALGTQIVVFFIAAVQVTVGESP